MDLFNLNNLFVFLLLVISTEAVTELLTKSEFFRPVRKFFFNKSIVFNFVHSLLDCGYCTSVWVSFINLVLYLNFNKKVIFLFFIFLSVHRLSNWLHNMYDKLFLE